jgi:uncharacterized membrane protein
MDLAIINRKPGHRPKTGDKSLQTSVLSLVLRGGVIISACIIAFGMILFLLTGQSGYASLNSGASGNEVNQYLSFHQTGNGQLYFPTNPVEIWQGVTSLKPFALIMLGLVLLIATPILNVTVAAIEFIQQRNRAFSLISLFVLAVLVLSFFLGKAGG